VATGKPISEPLKGHDDAVLSRDVQPRRQAHRHRVRGQDGARLGRLSRHAGANLDRKGGGPTLPHPCAAQGLLPAARAASMVYRDGEVALRHAHMEAVARR
jgi:hypothetical protein